MSKNKAEIMLHPIRLKIVQTLINGRRLTVQEIGKQLHEVPQASLYRHLKQLLDAGIIAIVEENKIRGAMEKVYALTDGAESIDDDDFLNGSKEEHMDYFMRFLMTVLADFENYVDQENFNMVEDGVGYRQAVYYASDDEFKNFLNEMRGAMKKVIGNEPSEIRRKRTLSTIMTTEHYPTESE
ncbi:MAG: helix-turn-helix domain-containing protein [Anaerobacillus sp.]